ncbi:pro-resilin-like [Portunus trituberculatus]|uniref:pro-resilin-like n=1 Tax=Portunus trituberculatus TaxID=210409 RepID=UPI001E1CB012|nr:pro-resilin-like [Portunus trituberculatus]
MKMHVAAAVAVVLAAALVQAHPQSYNYEPPQPPQPPADLPRPPAPTHLCCYLRFISSIVQQHEGMPYDFQWGVQDEDSGNTFSHVENSDGQTTQGEYRVLLPDGRTQVVKFFDNGDGYNAEVTYEK